jgi:hypothetical protein
MAVHKYDDTAQRRKRYVMQRLLYCVCSVDTCSPGWGGGREGQPFLVPSMIQHFFFCTTAVWLKACKEAFTPLRACHRLKECLSISVADPDPPDPHVSGPPGYGSISQRYGSGSGFFYHHAKIVRKIMIPTIL